LKFYNEHKNLSFEEISYEYIRKWFLYLLTTDLSLNSINLIKSAMASFFNYCIEEEILKINPMIAVDFLEKDERKEPYLLSGKDIFMLKESMKNNLRDRAMLEVFLCTGVRVTELINIEINNINFKKRNIKLEICKDEIERFVFITKECKERLILYLNHRKRDSKYLFTTRHNKQFTRQGVWKIVKDAAFEAKLSVSISPHSFRNYFATKLDEKGADIGYIMYLLGHESEESTKLYCIRTTESLRNLYDQYHR